jgi:hypothetical protein
MRKIDQMIYILLGVIIIALGSAAHYFSSEVKTLQKDNAYYHENYKSKVGGTLWKDGKWINYDLRTFDGGEHWVALGEGGKILGDVNKVVPGLLQYLDNMDYLTEYIRSHGPINPDNMTDYEREMLKNIGVEISRTKNK